MLCDKLECFYWLLFRPGLALKHRELLAGALGGPPADAFRRRRVRGCWDAAAREIRYPDVEPARRRRRARTKSSKGDDDDDAIPMGFGVGHPSFKAAFPVSESWGS